jgi:hypothetical protein
VVALGCDSPSGPGKLLLSCGRIHAMPVITVTEASSLVRVIYIR